MKRIFCIALHFTLLCVFCFGQKGVGDSCTVERTNSGGTCTILDDCPEVIAEIFNQSLSPTSCGFIKDKQIVCCANPTPTVSFDPSAVTRISQQKCAVYRPADDLICHSVPGPLLNDGSTKSMEFPHMVRIGYEDGKESICGGSLISDEYVLTAAHCSESRATGPAKFVRLGPTKGDDGQSIEVNIAEFIKHPDFKEPSRYNDIALLKLDRKISFNSYIRPACLTDTFQPKKNSAIAIGYEIKFTDDGIKVNDTLVKQNLAIYAQDECSTAYSGVVNRSLRDGILEESQICAGLRGFVMTLCNGNGGNALQIYHPEQKCMYELIGINSFGKDCRVGDTPGVYTRIFHYLDWIESIVWPNK